jgi:hypothetical protein
MRSKDLNLKIDPVYWHGERNENLQIVLKKKKCYDGVYVMFEHELYIEIKKKKRVEPMFCLFDCFDCFVCFFLCLC